MDPLGWSSAASYNATQSLTLFPNPHCWIVGLVSTTQNHSIVVSRQKKPDFADVC